MMYDSAKIFKNKVKKIFVLLITFGLGAFCYQYFAIDTKFVNFTNIQSLFFFKEYNDTDLKNEYDKLLTSWNLQDKYKKQVEDGIDFVYVSLDTPIQDSNTKNGEVIKQISISKEGFLQKDRIYLYGMVPLYTKEDKEKIKIYMKFNEAYLKTETIKYLVKKNPEIQQLGMDYIKEQFDSINARGGIKTNLFIPEYAFAQKEISESFYQFVQTVVSIQGRNNYKGITQAQFETGDFQSMDKKGEILSSYIAVLLTNGDCLKELNSTETGKKLKIAFEKSK